MSSNKGPGQDLNRPLHKLLDRLRTLQQGTGDALEAARRDSPSENDAGEDSGRNPAVGREIAAGFETQITRAAFSLLERWDIPTRADLDAIRERLTRLERDLASLTHVEETGKTVRKIASPPIHPAKRPSRKTTSKTPKPAAKTARKPRKTTDKKSAKTSETSKTSKTSTTSKTSKTAKASATSKPANNKS